MIIVTGVAGSGKTTQAKWLAGVLGCPYVSMSGLLHRSTDEAVARGIAAGQLLGDEYVLPLLESELNDLDALHKQVVLDGSPRTLSQAKWLADEAKAGKFTINAVLHLTADPETVTKRLLARGRADDIDDVIAIRIGEYQKAVRPILELLHSEGFKIHDISATGSEETVSREIKYALRI